VKKGLDAFFASSGSRSGIADNGQPRYHNRTLAIGVDIQTAAQLTQPFPHSSDSYARGS
jgi:hypothetical protein